MCYNVSSFYYDIINYHANDYYYDNTNIVINCENIPENTDNIYLIIENFHADAFGHFIYESLIYLNTWKYLKEIYRNIKVVIISKKKFKILLLDLYDIKENDIIYYDYSLDQNIILENDKNLCFFIPFNTLHESYVNKYFINSLDLYTNIIDTYKKDKNIDFLFLPRQTNENYKPNDRTYENMSGIINNINEYFQNKMTMFPYICFRRYLYGFFMFRFADCYNVKLR
jgi:hypothetical protein